MRSISLVCIGVALQFTVLFAQNSLENLRLVDKFEIFFESTKHNLNVDAPPTLIKAENLYNDNPKRKIRITAHTDGVGNAALNSALADKRANSVKNFFLEHGVPSDAILISTFGKDRPIADNDSEEGRKLNRRAVVEVYEPGDGTVKYQEPRVVEKPVSKKTKNNKTEQTISPDKTKEVIAEKQVVIARSKEAIADNQALINNEKEAIASRQAALDKEKASILEKQAAVERGKEELARLQMQFEKMKGELAANQASVEKERLEIEKKQQLVEKAKADITKKQVEAEKAKAVLAGIVEKAKAEIAEKQALLENANVALSDNQSSTSTPTTMEEKPVTMPKQIEEQPMPNKSRTEKPAMADKSKNTATVAKNTTPEKPKESTMDPKKVAEPVAEKPAMTEKVPDPVVEQPAKTEKVEAPVVLKPMIRARVTNLDLGTSIPAVGYYLNDSGVIDSVKTDESGYLEIPASEGDMKSMDFYTKGFLYQSVELKSTSDSKVQSVRLRPLYEGSSYTISNLYFEGDAATMLDTTKPQLIKILRFLRLNQGIKIELAGHVNAPGVDPKKLPKEEFDLSVTRAKVIFDFLVNNGINANTLSYKGYGNSRMKYPTPQNEAQENENRRVEIKVLKL